MDLGDFISVICGDKVPAGRKETLTIKGLGLHGNNLTSHG